MTSELSYQQNDAITYFTSAQYFLALGTVAKSVRALSRHFGMKFLWLEIR